MATIDTEQQLRDSLSDWLHTRKPFGRMHQVTLEDSPPQDGLANLLAGLPDEILRVETAPRPNTDEIERLLGRSGISFSKRQLELLEENARQLTIQTPVTLSDARMALVAVLIEHTNPAVGSVHRSEPADFTHIIEHAKIILRRGYGTDLFLCSRTGKSRNVEQFRLPTLPPRPSGAEDDNDPQDGYDDSDHFWNAGMDHHVEPITEVKNSQVKNGTVTIDGLEYDLVPKKKNDRPKPQGRKIRL